MGRGCSYCTLWADGFNGIIRHLENRAAFVVISPDKPEIQRDFAQSRGWTFRMLSGAGSKFAADMGFAEDAAVMPGVSTFRRESGGKIVRVGKASFGPGDLFCSAWHIFDLLKEGRNGWEPKLTY
jgi:predicted dithiol-disulfide oxidoreductase (DUF899 family)